MASRSDADHPIASPVNTPTIGISGLFAGILLLAPAIWLIWKLRLGFNRDLLTGAGRMIIQLGFVGLYLSVIFKLDNVFVTVAYLGMMIFFAALSGIKNSSLRLRRFLAQTFVAMLIPTVSTLFYFNLAVVQVPDIFRADVMIPVGGMVLGNILKSNIVALKTFFTLLKREEKIYFYLLAAGATRNEALRPFVKEAVKTAMAPNLAMMATAGLVSLPGMMTGQILGGSDPALAVKYQILIMIVIFVTSLLSILIQLYFAIRQGFDRHDRFDRTLLTKS